MHEYRFLNVLYWFLQSQLAYIRPKFEEVHIGNVGMIKLVRRYVHQSTSVYVAIVSGLV